MLWSVCRDSEIWISMSIILNFARVSVSFGLSQYRKGIDCRKNNGTWQSQRVWEKRKPSPVRLPLLRQRLQQEQDNVQDACIAGLITEPQLTLVCAITNRQMIARPESSAGLERSRDVWGLGYAPPQDNFLMRHGKCISSHTSSMFDLIGILDHSRISRTISNRPHTSRPFPGHLGLFPEHTWPSLIIS